MTSTNKNRPFDILIYGATGLAGQHVVKHFMTNHPHIKIAIAGRNETKLHQLASDLNDKVANNNPNSILTTNQILIASADNQQELIAILSQAKICLACAGPYRHMGRNIVEAAIHSNTDYLDLCGEPQFFDDMLTTYDTKARENKTLVISACAFDCVPAEMVYKLTSKEVRKRYGHTTPVTNVEIIHTFSGIRRVNRTTFDAAVDGFHASYTGELKASRDKVKESFPQLKEEGYIRSTREKPKEWKKFIQSPGLTSPLYHDYSQKYTLKFMGADAACILASDRYLRLRSEESSHNGATATGSNSIPTMPYLSVCFGLNHQSDAYKFLGFGAVFATLAKWSWGCKMLHSNPELFTYGYFTTGGPSEEEMKDATFTTYGIAYGCTKDQCVRVKFSGPEPGYIATSAMMSALALTVLNHRDTLMYEGGVMLPGAAFHDCEEVYESLMNEGINIEIVDDDEEDEDKGSASQADDKV